ncbi:MAG: flagellar biosynthetic protein FliR [Alphaproteobacteria bacterium]|jgi:flagellar biosynthetic protein FliR|nr:flagellar biosynthetic protein FliR [Alphaproteobacteria bacterium]MBL6777767.1 flagellar biosynthetic protein FliR [Alphaproteobacteria bacterium]
MFLPLTELQPMGGLPGLDLNAVMGVMAKFMLASVRIGAFFVVAPIFGSATIPVQVRVVMAAMLAIMVLAYTDVPAIESFGELRIIGVLITELLIGIAAGMILSIWFSAAVLAGEKIATSAGLGYAAQIDPNSGGQTPVVSQMLSMFMIILFLGMNGHLVVLRTMLESYSYLPIGAMPAWGAFIKGGIGAASSMFLAAAIIMLPIAIIMLLINLAVGVITRSAPQLNLFSFAFPISLLAIFIILYLSVDAMSKALKDLGISAMENLHLVMEAMSHG